MKIVQALPPNFEAIVAAFPMSAGPSILFAYAPDIYNPGDLRIPPQLIAHEKVHIERQGDDPAAWWERYINERGFRLEEELAAHIVEAQVLVRTHGNNRAARRMYIKQVGARLANPLYETGLSQVRGVGLIKRGLRA